MDAATSRSYAIFVEQFLASGQEADGPIDQHISGASIKGQHVPQLSAGRVER